MNETTLAVTSDVNLHETLAAAVWAKEFVRINGGDEGIMIAWFANAIMTGHDHSRWTNTKELTALLKIQGQNGNWNSSEYMCGLYNGLELSLSTIEGRSPEYRKVPEGRKPPKFPVCAEQTIGGEEHTHNEAYDRAMKILK